MRYSDDRGQSQTGRQPEGRDRSGERREGSQGEQTEGWSRAPGFVRDELALWVLSDGDRGHYRSGKSPD